MGLFGGRISRLPRGVALAALALAAMGGDAASAAKRGHVVVYDGWGTPTAFFVSGRVLEDKGERPPDKEASRARNLLENYRLLESDEVRGASVRVRVADQTFTATTDEDGVFTVRVKDLPAAQALSLGSVPLVAHAEKRGVQIREGSGQLWIHDESEPFLAIVSDIDDTIVKTFVTEKARMADAVLLQNGLQLEPVDGAAANYRKARDAGVKGFFYLSGSPQNFYGRLQTYLGSQGFPDGPLLLKNLGKDKPTQQAEYKKSRLEQLLRDVPAMRVILVGDSGERDPEIYRELRERHPHRVAGIVIRKTPGSNATPERFADMTLVDDRYGADDVIARLCAPARGALLGADHAPADAR
jgi:phosphatidate phosphatase APP1